MIKNSNYGSLLEARLEFKPHTPPKDVSGVKKRLKLPTNSKPFNTPLAHYLNNLKIEGKTSVNKIDRVKISEFYSNNIKYGKIEYHLKTNIRRMTLDIRATSEKEIKLSDHFNLEDFNNFITTGEMPKQQK